MLTCFYEETLDKVRQMKTCPRWMLMVSIQTVVIEKSQRCVIILPKWQMSHYLKRLNVFDKLNHMEPFQSWIQI